MIADASRRYGTAVELLAIKDQRTYGFQELSFAPDWFDPSLIREKATSDIMRVAALPSARTAFCRVYILPDVRGVEV